MGVLGKYESQPVGALGKIMTHKHCIKTTCNLHARDVGNGADVGLGDLTSGLGLRGRVKRVFLRWFFRHGGLTEKEAFPFVRDAANGGRGAGGTGPGKMR